MIQLPENVIRQAGCLAGAAGQERHGTAGVLRGLIKQMRKAANKRRLSRADRRLLRQGESALRQFVYGGVALGQAVKAAGLRDPREK